MHLEAFWSNLKRKGYNVKLSSNSKDESLNAMDAEQSVSYEEMQMLIKSMDKRPDSEYREDIPFLFKQITSSKAAVRHWCRWLRK